jgi:hypothetical protein
MKLTGENRCTRGKTCPSAALTTTNPTWTDPGSNPGLRVERPATNCLSHGTAKEDSETLFFLVFQFYNLTEEREKFFYWNYLLLHG